MLRALPAARAARAPIQRGAVRATRRYATESSAQPVVPKKKRHPFRRLVIYTTLAAGSFYVGSAFVALKFPPYYDVFVENVPLAGPLIQYAEDNNWDTLTVAKVIAFLQKQADNAQKLVNGEKIESPVVEKAKHAIESGKDRAKSVARTLKTSVEKSQDKIYEQGAKAAAIAKHRSVEFSEGVEDLVRKAEDAIAGKRVDDLPGATTETAQPASPSDTTPLPTEESTPVVIVTEKNGNVYDAPLPVGFEPPPGYSRPKPPKRAEPAPAKKAEPVPEPLPLVAPAVKEFGATEPVISQLASVIDNLASFLNTNPSAADKARDILDTAKVDLTQLATRIDEVKEEERKKLEAQLDEQTREYTLKLLELEMTAQDQLDSQEEGFRKFFEDEKLKFIEAYREKLNRELEAQSEIINERLKEEVIAQGIELQRRWIRDIKVRVEQERGGRLAKLDELATELKRLERVALDNSAFLDENLRIHAFWSALRALTHTVDGSARQPFRDELRVLRHIATAREDPVVSAVLNTLESSEVPDIGIEPFADLALWFSTSVAPRVSRVALVPDQNAGILSHLASHLLTSFTFKPQGLVPGSDVLSTLARAEYYMNEKDLDSATRELNQLGGTAKELLSDWLEAARKRLEVVQALEVMQTQATLASLLLAHQD
ncbi:hypothetical protein QCA50_014440 [Cerrena zonata]|uniref:MICOS complex subunit MIC60 n=1 Tax=Cerrena zonata TaxID=2478898 RepID=A0AAW0FUW0_9APHY